MATLKNNEGMTWKEWYAAVVRGPCCIPNAWGGCSKRCARKHMRFAPDDLVKAWTDCVDPAEYQAKTESAPEKRLEKTDGRHFTWRRIALVKGTRPFLTGYLEARGIAVFEHETTHTLRMAALEDYDGECVTSHTEKPKGIAGDGTDCNECPQCGLCIEHNDCICPKITLLDWYNECMRVDGKVVPSEGVTAADLAEYDIPLGGGCKACGATIAAYNACPTRSGYIACQGECARDGFRTVEEYAAFLVAQDAS